MKMKSFNNTDSEYPVHSSTCLHVPHRGKHWWGKIMVNLLLLKSMFGEMCESVQL